MGAGLFKKIFLLTWKNLKLRWRQKGWLAVEIIWPLALFAILSLVRFSNTSEKNEKLCFYDPKAMPSAGMLPFLQSYLCTLSNICFNASLSDQDTGPPSSKNKSFLLNMVKATNQLAESIADPNTETLVLDAIRLTDLGRRIPMSTPSNSAYDGIDLKTLYPDPRDLSYVVEKTCQCPLTNVSIYGILHRKARFHSEFFFLTVLLDNPNHCGNSAALRKAMFRHLETAQAVTEFQFDLIRHDFLCKDNCMECFLQQLEKLPLYRSELNKALRDLTGLDMNREQAMELKQVFSSLTTASLSPPILKMRRRMPELQHFLGQNHTDDIIHNVSCGTIRKGFLNALKKDTEDYIKMQVQRMVRQEFSNLQAAASISSDEKEAHILGADEAKKVEEESGKAWFSQVKKNPPIKLNDQSVQGNSSVFVHCGGIDIDQRQYSQCEDLMDLLQLRDNFMGRFLYILIRGFIVISPGDSEPVRKVADKVHGWLKSLDTLRGYVIDFERNSGLYHNVTARSGFSLAFKKFYAMILKTQKSTASLYPELIWNSTAEMMESVIWMMNDQYDRSLFYVLLQKLTFLRKFTQCFNADRLLLVKDEATSLRLAQCLQDKYLLLAVVDFKKPRDRRSLDPLTAYTIRMESRLMEDLDFINPEKHNPDPKAAPFTEMRFLYLGFSFLQDAIDRAIAEIHSSENISLGIYAQQFPSPCYTHNTFGNILTQAALLMNFGWIFSVAITVKNVVNEKEKRLKEVMRVMGVGNLTHWVAWFIQAFLVMSLSVNLLTIMLKTTLVFEKTDGSLILVLTTLYVTAVITQSFLISTWFHRASMASTVGALTHTFLYIPYALLIKARIPNWNSWQALLACLISQSTCGAAMDVLVDWELGGEGAQWGNIHLLSPSFNSIPLQHILLMFLVDIAIHILLIWYIEIAFPGEFGIRRPFYFPFTLSYWRSFSGIRKKSDSNVGYDSDESIEMKDRIEAETDVSSVGVSIQNLRKVYGHKVAVNNLSINFLKDQITSFLGHNGAGKTTTLSILTGLIPATSGKVLIDGVDIHDSAEERRVGMCPQYNVLFDRLTVEEQMWFYACLKGLSFKEANRTISPLLHDLKLSKKSTNFPSELSGGMQRKLSIGIAFIGDSKTVVLDEPTAGVDPYARRSIWDLLLKYKAGRTMILTTHHMDEADLLGDRIAIVSKGRLLCLGSSIFLKSKFGFGFRLSLLRAGDEKDLMETEAPPEKTPSKSPLTSSKFKKTMTTSTANPELMEQTLEIMKFVRSFFPTAEVLEDYGLELPVKIPATDTQTMIEFFNELESRKWELRIETYGISETPLEQIFLRLVGQDEVEQTRRLMQNDERIEFRIKMRSCIDPGWRDKLEAKKRAKSIRTEKLEAREHFPEPEVSRPYWLFRRHILALILKRMHNYKRNLKDAFVETLLPVILIAVALGIIRMIEKERIHQPKRLLHPWKIPSRIEDISEPFIVFISDRKKNHSWNTKSTKIIHQLVKPPGLGLRCLKDLRRDVPVEFLPHNCNEEKGRYPSIRPSKFSQASDASSMFRPKVPNEQCGCENINKTTMSRSGKWKCNTELYRDSEMSLLPSNDYLVQLSNHSISDWILVFSQKHRDRRFGGFSIGEVLTQLKDYDMKNASAIMDTFKKYMVPLKQGLGIDLSGRIITVPVGEFDPSVASESHLDRLMTGIDIQDNLKVWFNNRRILSLPAFQNILSNAILRHSVPRNAEKFGIAAFAHPLPYSPSELKEKQKISVGGGGETTLLVVIIIILGFSFVPANLVLFAIQERVSQAKHLQIVSGLEPLAYWVANFIWDMSIFMLPSLLAIATFLLAGEEAFTGSPEACGASFLLLCAFGFAVVPITYPLSFLFDLPSLAFIALGIGGFFVGTIGIVTTQILDSMAHQMGEEDKFFDRAADLCRNVFLCVPSYALGQGFIEMRSHFKKESTLQLAGGTEIMSRGYFDWDFLGKSYLVMAVEGVIACALTVLIEYDFFSRQKINSERGKTKTHEESEEDKDVVQERRKVQTAKKGDKFMLLLKGLRKVYRKGGATFEAVKGLSLGVKKGECFGLLGVNGAGKTTTFKMLTGRLKITDGDALVDWASVSKNFREIRRKIGYCPQFDALNEKLTAREQLNFYARLRGFREKDVPTVVAYAIKNMDLESHADLTSQGFSGGQKRKLSTAIAIIGNPQVILLDEPTAGMDPKARRFTWERVIELTKQGKTVLLTSHSMEECENLCSRIGIMVNGSLKCIGSAQHLKSRFGEGYTLTLKLKESSLEATEMAATFIRGRFEGAVLKELHRGMVEYRLPEHVKLATIFAVINDAKEIVGVDDYSLCQTTLDQVFLYFAGKQAEDSGRSHPAVEPSDSHQNPKDKSTPENSNERSKTPMKRSHLNNNTSS